MKKLREKRKTLRKSHDDMARFIRALMRYSDNKFGGPNGRSEHAQKQYLKARKLLDSAPKSARS